MEEYFYLTGKVQNGPFSIEEIKTKNLTSETFVWTEGMEDWKKIKDVPLLFQSLNAKKVPPPPPVDVEEKIPKTEISGQLNITTQKAANPNLDVIKPSKSILILLIVWGTFHLFALLMSYSQIDTFNSSGKPHADKFWPIVEFQHCEPNIVQIEYETGKFNEHKIEGAVFKMPIKAYRNEYRGELCYFRGIFYQYDWTEFLFYVGGALIIYLLVKISNKDKKIYNSSNERRRNSSKYPKSIS